MKDKLEEYDAKSI